MFSLMYLVVGSVAGLMSGLFGIGGGIIIIPSLAKLFLHADVIPPNAVMHMAIGTSLATVIFTAIAALYAHHQRKTVRWDMLRFLVPGLIFGAVVGSCATNFLSSGSLRIFFGVFLAVLGLHLLLGGRNKEPMNPPSPRIMHLMSCLIGGLSGLLGVGGGILLVPFLLRCQLDIRSATGTSVTGAFVVGVVATLSFMIGGLLSPSVDKVAWSTGYIYWPAFFGIVITSMAFAPVGAMLAHKLPREILKRFFAVLVLFMACDMLFLTR